MTEGVRRLDGKATPLEFAAGCPEWTDAAGTVAHARTHMGSGWDNFPVVNWSDGGAVVRDPERTGAQPEKPTRR